MRPGTTKPSCKLHHQKGEMNIKFLSDEGGQVFNLKLSVLDGLQVVVIIGFLPKFF
jgi:hypothetical protein